jgi:sugar lactone lactonase YvrE
VARWLNGTVDVITLEGELVAEIPAGGSKVTNLCFWEKSTYVTVDAAHSIFRLDAGVGGKPYTA